ALPRAPGPAGRVGAHRSALSASGAPAGGERRGTGAVARLAPGGRGAWGAALGDAERVRLCGRLCGGPFGFGGVGIAARCARSPREHLDPLLLRVHRPPLPAPRGDGATAAPWSG